MIKLNIKAFGLAMGILWAAYALLLGISSMALGWGTEFVRMLATVYKGYDATLIGCIIGSAWAFIDALVCGVLFAWLYNKFAK